MKLRYIFATIAAVAALSACNADMDYDIVAPILSKPDASSIQASLQGDNYVITWPAGNQNMQVTRYANGTKSGTEVVTGGTYTHYAVETNVANSYVLNIPMAPTSPRALSSTTPVRALHVSVASR